MDINLIILLDFLALAQGILLGSLLMIISNKQRPSLFLGLFLFTYSLELTSSIAEDLDFYTQYPALLFIHLKFYYASVVFFFFYCKQIVGKFSIKKDFPSLLPGALEVIFFGILFLQSPVVKNEMNESLQWELAFQLIELGGMLYSITMIILTLRLIKQNHHQVVEFYSYTIGKTLNWLKWTARTLLLLAVLIVVTSLIGNEVVDSITYPILSGINVVIIFWVGLSGFKQQAIFQSLDTAYPVFTDAHPSKEIEQEALRDEEDYTDLVSHMKDSACFINPSLQLAELADRVNIPVRRLSMLINQQAGLNFNQFINQYRVSKAKELLVDRKFDHLNMIGIAHEVGFNSKTSFYNAFKEHAKMTPQQFKKQGRIAAG